MWDESQPLALVLMAMTNRRLRFSEQLEPRHCLSAVTFLEHDLPNQEADWLSVADVADLNGDGHNDLILIASEADNSVSLTWRANLTGRTFASPTLLATFGYIEDATTSDVDGDGDLDLVIAGPGIHWYENINGQGRFGTAQTIAGAENRYISLIADDLDGDMHPEFIAFEKDDFFGSSFLFKRSADRTEFVKLPFPVTVHVADIDGDGNRDLISHNANAWRRNMGDLTFGERIVFAGPGGFLNAVLTTDVDGDGHLDVIAQNRNDISWFANDPPGELQFRQRIGPRTWPFAAGDLDRDGDPDLVASDDEIVWYENLNGRIFGAPTQIQTSVRHFNKVVIADLDNDLDQDFVIGQFWYESRLLGDSDDNGIFNSRDLVRAFEAGKYEDDIGDNATFEEGDWNQDGDFDSSDLVLAFKTGHYESVGRPLAAEIAAAVDWLFTQDDDAKKSRAFVA